jgi:N-acyl homoserine lactone hydrolase
MGGDPCVGQHYRPRRTGLELALSTVDVSVDDIDLVANCHPHFDHCGGNAFFAGKPILTQATERLGHEPVDPPQDRPGHPSVLPAVTQDYLTT